MGSERQDPQLQGASKRRWYQAPTAGFASEVQRRTRARVVAPAAAAAAVKQLEEGGSCTFFVARLWVPAVVRPDAPSMPHLTPAQRRILPHVKLGSFSAKGITIGRILEDPDEIWLGVLTTLKPEDAAEAIFSHSKKLFQAGIDRSFTRPDAWRFANDRAFHKQWRASKEEQEPAYVGEPLALEMVSGPHSHIPDDLESSKQVRACSRGFALPGAAADLNQVARSEDTADLQQLLRLGYNAVFAPNAQGITPLHLAALTGDVAVATAAAVRARAGTARAWRDRHGRTPLHYAAFFDSPGLVRALWGLGEPGTKDRWGRTALDLASGLGHHAAAAALAQEPRTLQQLSGEHVLRLLRGTPGEAAVALGKTGGCIPSGLSLRSCVPLHEYTALQRLAQVAPGEMKPCDLVRSMSCMECWYADLLNCGCSPAVPGCLELLSVWDEPKASWQGGEAEADNDGELLVRAPPDTTVSPLADRETFVQRFHQRTGGVLAAMDWSNVMVIGGMALACLTATDEEYERNYRETDVDIYIVGLSGEAFRKRVAEVVSTLPRAREEDDYTFCLEDGYTIPVKLDEERYELLVAGEVQGEAVDKQYKGRRDGMPRPGDQLIEVDHECAPEAMEEALQRKVPCRWAPDQMQHHVLKVRPREALARRDEPSSTLLRTPQTLTAVLRDHRGRPLPNVQVVLAPYSSPAHLLFTTDLDCVAMGFDGKHLLGTPRAREALRRRRNIARPEKYAVRGEWRTEARLLKYVSRGFRLVDLGLRKGAKAPPCAEAIAAAADAAPLLLRKQPAEDSVRRVRDSGAHGARLLMLARRDVNLMRLMLHEEPLLKAGTERQQLIMLARERRLRLQPDNDDDDDNHEGGNDGANDNFDDDFARERRRGGPAVNGAGKLEMDDGYGRGVYGLLVVNPARLDGHRVGHCGLRGVEVPLEDAIAELNLEADRFEVRSWYEGLREEHLRTSYATLDPQTWRGIGDFRSAP